MGMTEQEAIEQFEERLSISDYRCAIPEYYNAMELAVKALEKQIAKKPTSFNGKIFNVRNCPKCRIVLTDETNYCSECGQKLDWSGEDAE
jgi:hypothetical protein